MVWIGDNDHRLAGSLLALLRELEHFYPAKDWQTDPGTGTIGDTVHRAEGQASDHNPWFKNTVRALDVARTGDGPDCEQLFRMVNKMFADHDPRVFPDGYAIYRGRVTDWENPGGYHTQQGDPHTNHVHISVSTTAQMNSLAQWPIPAMTKGDTVTDEQMQQLHDWIRQAADRQIETTKASITHAANRVITAITGVPVPPTDPKD